MGGEGGREERREGEREGGTDGGSRREEREGGEGRRRGRLEVDKLSILLPSPSLSRRAMTCTMH